MKAARALKPRGFLLRKGKHMIVNPGTQHFDFAGAHTVIITDALYPAPGSSVSSLSNNPVAVTS
jgi:hypothetical protein